MSKEYPRLYRMLCYAAVCFAVGLGSGGIIVIGFGVGKYISVELGWLIIGLFLVMFSLIGVIVAYYYLFLRKEMQ